MRLFVYGTLKQRGILDEALAHNEHYEYHPAEIAGVREVYRHFNGTSWPTLIPEPMGHSRTVKGELLAVDGPDLVALDHWESHYMRIIKRTLEGEEVWVYVLAPR